MKWFYPVLTAAGLHAPQWVLVLGKHIRHYISVSVKTGEIFFRVLFCL